MAIGVSCRTCGARRSVPDDQVCLGVRCRKCDTFMEAERVANLDDQYWGLARKRKHDRSGGLIKWTVCFLLPSLFFGVPLITWAWVAAKDDVVSFIFPLIIIIMIVDIAVQLASWWTIFEKADEPGWAAIVPIYNFVVTLRVVGKPFWWLFLFLIPVVNVVLMIFVMVELARRFGKGMLFTVGLILLPDVFRVILAFDSSKYKEPAPVWD
jgi:hypothetical protein